LRHKHAEFQALGAALVTVSPDAQAATSGLVERLELPYLVLSDPDLAAVDAYDVRHDNEPAGRLIPRPGAFIIDRDGRIQFAYKGDSVPDRPSEDALLDFLRTLRRSNDSTDDPGSHRQDD